MKTSYFAKSANHPNAVSIAGRAPDWYKGRQYKKLAPKYWFFKRYKDEWDEKCGDQNFYIEQFQKEVLDKLDPIEVAEELGNDAILLCWEKPDKFCHRHLVSKWLSEHLNIKIKELK